MLNFIPALPRKENCILLAITGLTLDKLSKNLTQLVNEENKGIQNPYLFGKSIT